MKVIACSTGILVQGMGPPLRGFVHSVFASAANLLFPDGFVLSLNALPHFAFSPKNNEQACRHNDISRLHSCFIHSGREAAVVALEEEVHQGVTLPLMPNGLLLSAYAGEFPFTALRVGMPAILGAGWLSLEAIACSLDFVTCPRWDPHIVRSSQLNEQCIKANGHRLRQLCQRAELRGIPELEAMREASILVLAEELSGRGPGLTPGGDDFLAGWMAAGWLLYGPQADFLKLCQDICAIARRRTHVLSQSWLTHAAVGEVAQPIRELLAALNTADQRWLEYAARGLLAMGASSGFDVLQGILYSIEQYPDLL
jgi:hypothetical protein